MKNFSLITSILIPILLSGCQSTSPSVEIVAPVDVAQGSVENIASLTAVINNQPADPNGYNVRGSAYGKAGRYPQALADFDTALRLNPRFYAAYANRALIHLYMKNEPAALADYNRALAINPDYGAGLIGRGNLYCEAGQLDLALTDYNRAIELGTLDARAWHNRALIKQARGLHAQAITDFGTAISHQPSQPDPYNGRSLSYIALGDLENAMDDINAVLLLDRRNAMAWVNQGVVYEQRGERTRAIRSYNYALSLNPQLSRAREGLGRLRS